MKYQLITEDENYLIHHGLFDNAEAALDHVKELFQTDLTFDPEGGSIEIHIKRID